MDSDTIKRIQQYQMMQQYQKKYQNKKNLIIIIAIIVGLLVLIGAGIGLYFAFANNDNSETFKVNLPDELKNISLPSCINNTCIKVGEKLSVNQILSSDNITMTIRDNLNGIQKMKNGYPLLTTLDNSFKLLGEESSPYYLIIYNKKNNRYNYLYLNNREFKLVPSGLQDGNKIIPLLSSKIEINGKTYFIDQNYDKVNDIKLLVNDNGIPYTTIYGKDLNNISGQYKVIEYTMDSIGYILLTDYSILVFNTNNKLVGIISTAP